MFRSTGANAVAKNQMRLAYEDKRDLYCSDQGREFENGLMKSLCTLLGCTKTRTAPYRPASDCMIERFNRTCLMMLSMFVNDRSDNWDELLPYGMHAYRTSVH